MTVAQWQSFESDIEDVCRAAATKLPVEKAQELETILAEFLVDVASTSGPTAPAEPEKLSVPIFETRAALMILLISLV